MKLICVLSFCRDCKRLPCTKYNYEHLHILYYIRIYQAIKNINNNRKTQNQSFYWQNIHVLLLTDLRPINILQERRTLFSLSKLQEHFCCLLSKKYEEVGETSLGFCTLFLISLFLLMYRPVKCMINSPETLLQSLLAYFLKSFLPVHTINNRLLFCW